MNNLNSPIRSQNKNENVATSAAEESTFCSRMSALLQGDQNVYDVTFIVGIEKIEVGAHRFILKIQSPKFKKMFEGEPTAYSIVEDDVTPTEFRKFLEYLYTGIFTDDSMYALPLLELAVKYDIPDLQKTCTRLLEKTLDLKSVVKVYEQACKYELMNLKQKCQEYICRYGNKILDSSEFLHFTNYNLQKIIAMDELRAENETQVFKAVLKWGKNRCQENGKQPTGTNLRLELEDLIPFIRFPVMNKSDFSLEVAPSQILTDKEIISVLLYYNVEEYKKERIAPGSFSAAQRKWTNKQDMPVGPEYILTRLKEIQLPIAQQVIQLKETAGQPPSFHGWSSCRSCGKDTCRVCWEIHCWKVAHSTTVTPTVVLGLSAFGPYYLETLKSSSELKLIPEYKPVHRLKLRSSHSIRITKIYINKSYSEVQELRSFDLGVIESETGKNVFSRQEILQTVMDQTPSVEIQKPFPLRPEIWYTIILHFKSFYNCRVYAPMNERSRGIQEFEVPVTCVKEPIHFEFEEDNAGYYASGLIPMIAFKAN